MYPHKECMWRCTSIKPRALQASLTTTCKSSVAVIRSTFASVMDPRLLLTCTIVYFIAFTASQGEASTCQCSNQIITSQERLWNKVEQSLDALSERIRTLTSANHGVGLSSSYPAISCKEIFIHNEDSPSGYYWVKNNNGHASRVYCEMTKKCGVGGWMRVAQLDTAANPYHCPNPLSRFTESGKNLCGRRKTEGGCSEVRYYTNDITYNEVCGKIIGYQKGSTDGPYAGALAGINIDGAYIDGVSLTHGSPKQHIWTFISALDESGQYRNGACRCSNKYSRGNSPPSFVGTDYFCDSGSINRVLPPYQFYSNSPLWDGAGCSSNSECCRFQNPPWFYKKLGTSTADRIDMRLCRDEHVSNEDVLLEKVSLYVR